MSLQEHIDQGQLDFDFDSLEETSKLRIKECQDHRVITYLTSHECGDAENESELEFVDDL